MYPAVAAVIASDEEGLAVELQHAVNSSAFRAYVSGDVAGAEDDALAVFDRNPLTGALAR